MLSQLKSVGEELKQQSEESMLASQALSSKAAAEALSEAQKEVAEYEKTVMDSSHPLHFIVCFVYGRGSIVRSIHVTLLVSLMTMKHDEATHPHSS